MSVNRRGGVYIAVLGVTLFVTLIGLSAMLLVETERETRIAVSESRSARTDARSAMEIALSRIAQDAAWRTSHPSGAWSEVETLGDTKWGYMLNYDEGTPSDETVDVSMTVGARRHEAARFFSVEAMVPPSTGKPLGSNLVRNADFESGAAPWAPVACVITSDKIDAYGGSASLAVSSRIMGNSGPYLELKGDVGDGVEYELSMYVRMEDGATDTIRVTLTATVNALATADTVSVVGVDQNWTKVSGTLVADWEDGREPSSVTLRVDTRNTLSGFRIDDVELREVANGSSAAVRVVSGSFRQRVLE